MFNLLAIDKDDRPIQKGPKLTPPSTVSKPSQDKNVDFLDFVPIENNSEDFDIANILSDIQNTEQKHMITYETQNESYAYC